MEQKVAFGKSRTNLLRAFDKPEGGEPSLKHFSDAVFDVPRPEVQFGLGEMFFQKGEDSGSMRDIANVHRLPRRAQEEAWGARAVAKGNG